MSDTALPHDMPSVYEPSLFGTYSKKIGMWLFLISDSLTFGALLYSYSYGRISTPSWPTPFHSESIVNATIMTAFLLTSSLTMVLGVRASADGDKRMLRLWLLGTMICGTAFIVLHAREWSKLIAEGLTLPAFPKLPEPDGASEFASVSKTVPQFASTFFGLTGMHMLHVTIGVIYLGVVALGRKVLPVLFACWLLAWLATPATSPFHYAAHVLLAAFLVCSLVLWLKPKVYDSGDVEVAGLYWHFVDLVWMFIFPLVYLMSAKIL